MWHHHLPNLSVLQVAPVGTNGPGVGVGGGKGFLGNVQHVPEPGVVEVGHVHHNARLLQRTDRLLPQRGKAVVGLVAGT